MDNDIWDGIEKDYVCSHEIIHQFPIAGNFLLVYNETLQKWYVEGVLEEDGEEYELPLTNPITEDLVTDHFILEKKFYDRCKAVIGG